MLELLITLGIGVVAGRDIGEPSARAAAYGALAGGAVGSVFTFYGYNSTRELVESQGMRMPRYAVASAVVLAAGIGAAGGALGGASADV